MEMSICMYISTPFFLDYANWQLINRLVFSCSAIMSESSSKLHQGTRWSSRHAFPQVRNFIFVTHHTSNVQMGPMRSCDELSEECSCSTCTSRPKKMEEMNSHSQIKTKHQKQCYGEPIFGSMTKMDKNRRWCEKDAGFVLITFSHTTTAAHISCVTFISEAGAATSHRVLQRNIPAVFANVVEVCQLAVSHLSGVVLEQRHPPHSVTCHNTSLCRCVHTYTDTHTRC